VFQEYSDINSQVRALGQKYMGIRPQAHIGELFKGASIQPDTDGHPLPVSNFLNAQCMLFGAPQLSGAKAYNLLQTSLI
jgi:hypothetical protein